MKARLYRVNFRGSILAIAESEGEAEEVGYEALDEGVVDLDLAAHELDRVPDSDLSKIPFSSFETPSEYTNMTCRAFLVLVDEEKKRLAHEAKMAALQEKLPGIE